MASKLGIVRKGKRGTYRELPSTTQKHWHIYDKAAPGAAKPRKVLVTPHGKPKPAPRAPRATAPAPAPAVTPAAPPPAPLPPDATYDAQRGAADLQYGTTMAGLAGQRARSLSDYGYTEDAATHALSLDPNNPFSKAALLKQNYDRSRRSSAQSMGSTGQLYSGAFQNQQDLTNRGELGAQDTLQKSLGDFLSRNATAQGQAGVDQQTAYSRAEEGRVGRVDTNPLYDPAATIATPAAPAANTRGAVVTNKLNHKGRWVTRPNGTRYFQVV
jgi:hypothetical protein